MAMVVLRLPPDTQLVGLARLVVITAARDAGLDDERIEDLRLAVSEAITNAMLAHSRNGCHEPISLSVEDLRSGDGTGDAFAVTVQDEGPGFDPEACAAREREWSEENGLGLTLIKGLADHAEFVREGGMRVKLRFDLPAAV